MRVCPWVFPALLTAFLAATGCVTDPALESSEQDLAAGLGEPASLDEPAVLAADTVLEADTAALTGCQLYAEQPYWLGASIFGAGTWWNCPAGASVTVVLRHDRPWWPDRTLAIRSGTGSSGYIDLSYPCGTDFDPIKVFIEVRYGSQKVQSVRSVLPCG